VTELVADGTNAVLKLEEFLPYRLAILSAYVCRGLAQIHERYGLGWGDWVLLTTLGEVGPMTATAFGVRTGVHKTRVSRAVAVLLKRGLILRTVNPIDMRQALLRLSPSGKDVYDQMTPLARAYLKRLEEGISPDDLAALDRGMTRIGEQTQRLVSLP